MDNPSDEMTALWKAAACCHLRKRESTIAAAFLDPRLRGGDKKGAPDPYGFGLIRLAYLSS